ncbi:MAG TPA: hypothetical protein VEE84_07140 [Burkholderiaceae bacterium]|nr:hypothetical protein [Burkholderiaceae bacterium]
MPAEEGLAHQRPRAASRLAAARKRQTNSPLAGPCALALLLALAPTKPPRAQEIPLGFSWGPGETVAHDNNLTRVNSQSGYPTVSDTSYTTSLTATLHETYSRQDVMASATVGRVLYQTYSEFDATQENLRAALQSDLPLSASSRVTLVRTAVMAQFADIGGATPDVITRNEINGSVDFPLESNWRAVLGGDDSKTQNSASMYQTQNLNTTELNGGIRFQPVTGNHIDVLLRTLHAEYPNGSPSALVSSGYNERGADLRVDWTLTGPSHLLGRAGYLEHRNDEVPYYNVAVFPPEPEVLNRDFSGPGYDLTYIWQITGASRLTLYGLRQTGAAGDNNYLSAVTKTFRIAPAYQPRQMIGCEAYFEWTQRNYFENVYDVVTNTAPGTNRLDNSHNAGLSILWNPRRWLSVRLDVRHELRDSSISTYTYSDTNAALSLQTRF